MPKQQHYVKNQLSRIIGGTQIITNKRKYTCFYKIIHFFMQFSAVEIRFTVTTYLYFTFANDFKRKYFFRKMFIVTEYAALKGGTPVGVR